MIDRDELIEAGAQALSEAWKAGVLLSQNEPGGVWFEDYEKFTATVLDAIEPPIRADMDWHQKVNAESAVALMQWRDELQAKIEALRDGAMHQWVYQQAITDVLALIKDDDQ